jgi:hypothetical protein
MSTFSVRLHVRTTLEQRDRLKRAASARGTSVSTIVRGAIDLAAPHDPRSKRAAADAILAAPPMAVPTVDDLVAELDGLRGRDLG